MMACFQLRNANGSISAFRWFKDLVGRRGVTPGARFMDEWKATDRKIHFSALRGDEGEKRLDSVEGKVNHRLQRAALILDMNATENHILETASYFA